MSIAIKIENISKSYILRHQQREHYSTFREVLVNKLQNVFSSNSKLQTPNSELFWALKDISFDVQQGDRIGIIGRNGAGKSTLLKILSRITEPTSGKVFIKGRVASLLEVGTGFHPELTGRENIFLNGSILGMNKAEIKKKFDEIVAFAEIEKFLDTPVKRYSSGMYVRLAFAVAAHLEPEILIVDEVLAVGDAQFQKKCLGKMQEVSGGGRTIIFVSHNMQAVQKLCNKGILLHNGKLIEHGLMDGVANKYLASGNMNESFVDFDLMSEDIIGQPVFLRIENLSNELMQEIPLGKPYQVRVRFKINQVIEHFIIALGIKNYSDVPIRTSYSNPTNIIPGEYEVVFKYDDVMLSSGNYTLVLGLSSYEKSFFYQEGVTTVQISDVSELIRDNRIVRNSGIGFILNPIDVIITKI